MNDPQFGTVRVYGETHRPKHVVILMSGEDGWTPALTDRARALTHLDTLVAGVESKPFLAFLTEKKGECGIVSKSFRKLAKFIQNRYGYDNYMFPVLAGVGQGSAITYAALVQAVPDVFAGAISFGFCPSIELSKPFCAFNDLKYTQQKNNYTFTAPAAMRDEWNILQDGTPSSCAPSVARTYIKNVKNARVIATGDHWLETFRASQNRMAQQQEKDIHDGVPAALNDLPLDIMQADHPAPGKPVVVFISGDGGWARIDNGMAKIFNARGITVVGFDSLRYFWKPKTPDQAAADINRVIRYYDETFKPSGIILVGYSRGADVLPFVMTRMPVEEQAHIRSIALLAPGTSTKFKFNLMDWLPVKDLAVGISVGAELQKILTAEKVLCFYGKTDTVTDSICPHLDARRYKVIARDGDHHFNEKYQELVEQI